MESLPSFYLGICLSICFCLNIGLQRTAGIYFIYYQEEFNATASQISSVLSLSIAMMYLGGPLHAAIFKSFGPAKSYYVSAIFLIVGYVGTSLSQSLNTLIIFHGIILGLGYGLGIITAYTIIGQSYDKKRAILNNLMAGIASIFGFMAAPLTQIAIPNYTWRGVMLLQAALVLNTFPVAYLASKQVARLQKTKSTDQEFNKPNEVNNVTETGQFKVIQMNKKTEFFKTTFAALCDKSLLLDPIFMTYCVAVVGVYSVAVVTMQFLVRYAQDIGIESQTAANMMSVFHAMTFVFCVIVGMFFSNGKIDSLLGNKISKPHVLVFLCWTQSLVHLIPIFWQTSTGYWVYVTLLGITFGSIGSLPMTVIPEMFGIERLAGAIGYRSLTSGVFTLIIPPFTGYLVDIAGNYRPVQYVAATMSFLGGFLLLFVSYRIKIKRQIR